MVDGEVSSERGQRSVSTRGEKKIVRHEIVRFRGEVVIVRDWGNPSVPTVSQPGGPGVNFTLGRGRS
jgi:hypothetical protein